MEQARHCAVLFADIAGSTDLHKRQGDAGARRMSALLRRLFELVGAHHGEVVKSDGDDVVAVFAREGHCAADAAAMAIAAHQAAQQAGLEVYTGLHAGPLRFVDVLGRRDLEGLAVNTAARLHKLTPGIPGSIFLLREMVQALPAALRAQARIYGERELKGLGRAEVHTLDWREELTVAPTLYAAVQASASASLELRHAAASLRLEPGDPPLLLGRSRSQCRLVVEDAGELPLVSSRHAQLLHRAGQWWLNDFSRNGTWLRDAATGEQRQVMGAEATLPRAGALCLGRSFAEDAAGRFTIHFQQA